MKIRFIQSPKGRDFKVGDVVDFNGAVDEGYARKYIARGWAEELKASEAAPDASDEDKQIAARAAELEARSKIEIPDAWADLKYGDLRSLASSVSDTPIHNRDEAVAAVTAEIARRTV